MFFCFFASADDKLGGKYLLTNGTEDGMENEVADEVADESDFIFYNNRPYFLIGKETL
jgi:hypothetical protein